MSGYGSKRNRWLFGRVLDAKWVALHLGPMFVPFDGFLVYFLDDVNDECIGLYGYGCDDFDVDRRVSIFILDG